MLINVSYNDRELTRKINVLVGKPHTFMEKLKMKGNGSPKLWINSASEQVFELLSLDKYINSCNIEIRPKGIIVRFRSILETFALIIPYYQLTIFKGKSDEISIYGNGHFIKIKANNQKIHAYFNRLIGLKALSVPSHPQNTQ